MLPKDRSVAETRAMADAIRGSTFAVLVFRR